MSCGGGERTGLVQTIIASYANLSHIALSFVSVLLSDAFDAQATLEWERTFVCSEFPLAAILPLKRATRTKSLVLSHSHTRTITPLSLPLSLFLSPARKMGAAAGAAGGAMGGLGERRRERMMARRF